MTLKDREGGGKARFAQNARYTDASWRNPHDLIFKD